TVREWVLRAILLPQLRLSSDHPGREAQYARLEAALREIDSWCWHLPLNSFPPAEGLADWYFEQLEHPQDGPYWWNRNTLLKVAEVDVPILHVTGWFDIMLGNTLLSFTGIR